MTNVINVHVKKIYLMNVYMLDMLYIRDGSEILYAKSEHLKIAKFSGHN